MTVTNAQLQSGTLFVGGGNSSLQGASSNTLSVLANTLEPARQQHLGRHPYGSGWHVEYGHVLLVNGGILTNVGTIFVDNNSTSGGAGIGNSATFSNGAALYFNSIISVAVDDCG